MNISNMSIYYVVTDNVVCADANDFKHHW